MKIQLWCPWCGKGKNYKVDLLEASVPMFKCGDCGFVGPESGCIRNEEAALALQDQVGLHALAKREASR